jgi:hypothetical protein
MRTRSIVTRGLALTAGAIAVAGAAASGAQAATIHACVKPKSGATRIVSAKSKCRHGEQKLSWNSEGPRGPAGANGTAGAPGAAGASGAGPLFSAASGAAAVTSSETPLASKVLPPGHYMLWAKTDIVESSPKREVENVSCILASRPGTTGTGELSLLDLSGSELELGETEPGQFNAAVTIPMQGALTTAVTATVTMSCSKENGGTTTVGSTFTQLQALGVTSVG